jgi:phage terminase large subunit
MQGDRLVRVVAEVFDELSTKDARYKGAFGGRGSGKSHFFAEELIEDALETPGLRVVCIREFQKSLQQSSKRLLEDKIQKFGLMGRAFESVKAEIRAPGNGLIIFQGMQDHTADSIKSLEGFDRFWVEEAQSISERSLELLRPTMRKRGGEMMFSWNATSADDPVDKFLRKEPPPGSIVVKANYDVNPWFPAELDFDRRYDLRRDPDRYAHVWLGEYRRNSEARVFRNWRVDEFDTPEVVDRFYFGADWGFSVDPTVLVRCWIKDRMLYVDHEAYKIGCEIDHTPELFSKVPGSKTWPIVADSARPETISYLKRKQFNIRPAIKGARSVEEGVEFLKSYDIVVHPRCTHTADELATYSYKIDRHTQEVLPVLADKDNHVIDSLRYAVEGVRRTGRGMVDAL